MKKIFACILIWSLIVTAGGCSVPAVGTKSGETQQGTTSKEKGKKKNAGNKKDKATDTAEEEIDDGAVMSDEKAKEMATQMMSSMSLEEKVSQMFVVNLELLDDTRGSYYEHRKCTKEMKRTLENYPVGGVVLFSRNIESREQTTQLIDNLQKNAKTPLFITVDEEGGNVARIASNDNMGTTSFPTMEYIGKNEDADYAYSMGETIGREIKELGFNVDFAPVADVKTNESNTEIGSRSFGSDADKVAEMVVNVVNGIQSQGVSATLKHFPGHGDAGEDSHEGSVNVDNSIMRMRKVDFVPFKEGIEAGVDFVMISHISVSRVTESTTPASLSSLIMREILRDELGFDGIIITDALNMNAITDNYSTEKVMMMSVRGGADILLMPVELETAVNAVLEAVRDGSIDEMTIDDSVLRILTVKYKRGIISIA